MTCDRVLLASSRYTPLQVEEWIRQLAVTAPYAAIVVTLLIGGFGVPISEDIPLVLAGYLCGRGMAEPWILFPLVFVGVLCTDLITYWLGARFGRRLLLLPVARRVFHEDRVARGSAILSSRGAVFIFLTRFVPGLRSPVIFAAGTLRMNLGRFLFYDGAAASIGVPSIVAAAYLLSDQIDWVRHRIFEGQLVALGIVVVVVAAYLALARLAQHRLIAGRRLS